jgi:mRNA interferase MazF
VTRGEIWWSDLGLPIGSAPGYTRPTVIISADRFNRSGVSTVTVVPLYSNLRLAIHPGNVLLPALDTGLDCDSVANVTQIASIDRSQVSGLVGVVPPSLMAQLDSGIRLVLGL